MAYDLAHFEQEKLRLRRAIAHAHADHKSRMDALTFELTQAEQHALRLAKNLDTEQILLAEHVLEIHGTYANAGQDRALQLESAIADLLAGCNALRHSYYGTKDYDRWHDQASDHTYGYGPRHGRIIFSIGLTRPVRTRIAEGGVLTPDELNAALYYLRTLEVIEQTLQEAAAAAGAP